MAKVFVLPEKTADFDPFKLLHELVMRAPSPGSQGFDPATMRMRIRIGEQMDESEDLRTIVLEDNDYAHVEELVKGFKGFIGGDTMKQQLELIDAVSDAKKVKKEAKKETE